MPSTLIANEKQPKMVYRNPQPLRYPADATVTELLLNHNLNNTPPDKPAIIDAISGEVVFTYASFRESVKKMASYFRDHIKLGPESIVGILSTNRTYYPICVHGILATGAVVSALNPLYESNELAHALKLSEPTHILVEKALLPRLVTALSALPHLQRKPTMHLWDAEECIPGVAEVLLVQDIIRHGNASFEPAKSTAETAQKQLAFICFSSGTSGLVKGVRLSHANIVANVFQQSQGLQGMFTDTTVVALIVPFFHILGLAGFCCQFVSQGAPIVVFPRFELRSLLKAVSKHRITHINVVPPIALKLLRNPMAAEGDYSSLRCIINAAAPLNQRQSNKLSRRFSCAVTQWYGMTEASPSISSQREDEMHIPGTIGRLLPGIEMRVVDEDGADARVGEFILRGPNIMQGYVDTKQKSEGHLTGDGYIRTGDIGYVDSSGYLFIMDRAKEMIKVKGNQVAPAELEAVLITHSLVEDAAVCGTYNADGTSEIPVAYITTKVQDSEGQEALKRDVLEHVHAQVARYKRLTGGVHILPSIPRNPSGKILRRLLPVKTEAYTAHSLAGNNSVPVNSAKL